MDALGDAVQAPSSGNGFDFAEEIGQTAQTEQCAGGFEVVSQQADTRSFLMIQRFAECLHLSRSFFSIEGQSAVEKGFAVVRRLHGPQGEETFHFQLVVIRFFSRDLTV